jgi:hypothetical protein
MSLERKKLWKAVREFGGYIATNQQFVPDYGDRTVQSIKSRLQSGGNFASSL